MIVGPGPEVNGRYEVANDRNGSVSADLNTEISEPRNSQFQQEPIPTIKSGEAPRWLVSWFWVCIVIAVAVAMRRVIALVHPTGAASPTSVLDATFASRTALTLAHIIPATAFVVLTPLVLFRVPEKRWPERALLLVGVIVGITAYAMSIDAFGGWTERSAVLFFNSLFLFSLCKAFTHERSGDILAMRRWLTRAIGILLGIATTRPVMGVFFATSRLTHLEPKQFFGIAFWIGFATNTIMVEIWLRAENSVKDQYGN